MWNERRVLFTGGSGLLGRAFQALLPNALYPSSLTFDVTDESKMAAFCQDHVCDLLVHAAAFTSPPKVDQDPIKALTTNLVGTANVVRLCAERGIKLVYISTDYVFKGDAGNYHEDDPVFPVNKYAWSKLGGECAVRLYDRSLIIRTSFGPDAFPYPKAFSDQWTSRQSVTATARQILALLPLDLVGTLHVGGPRRSVLDYARSLDPTVSIQPLSISDVSFRVPVDTSLNIERLRSVLGTE